MRNTPLVLALLLTLFCTGVRAQITADDFEDGDLLNPEWIGDTEDFVVENGRLRLRTQDSGESTLAVRLAGRRSVRPDSFSLEFLVEMDFPPSSRNYCTIDLIDEATEGTITANVIANRFGGLASGTDDRWTSSVVNEGDILVGTFAGTPGALGTAPAVVRFRITYDQQRGYRYLADYTGGRDFQLEGTIADNTWVRPDLLRLTCFYTATRSEDFSFDDLNASYVYGPDETPPTVPFAVVTSGTTATLEFSEVVRSLPAANFVSSLADNPVVAVSFAPASPRNVQLTFANPLPLRQDFTVTVAGLTDVAGNTTELITVPLRYEPSRFPGIGDLIINELMVDPDPPVALPDAEYIEIQNVADISLRLDGVGIRKGDNRSVNRAEELLAPGEHLVFVAPELADTFRALGVRVLPLDIPRLTNSGDEISLTYSVADLQTIAYTFGWYNDPARNDGGYSIEYVGGGADAGCSANWRASQDPSGGTPGRANSVLGMPADTVAPVVTLADISPAGVQLLTDEEVVGGLTADLFSFSPALVFTAEPTEDGVFLAADLVEGTVYTLTVLPDYADCAGNFPATALTFDVGVLSNPGVGDVVINEILFNPATGGERFVELFNCSDKIFQIEGWELSNNTVTSSNATKTINQQRLFRPGDYLTFTPEPQEILTRFLEVNAALLVDQTLPTLGNDEGNITVSANGLTLDAFDYTEDFHSELLSPNDGVSLERIRQKSATQDGSNWFSAASTEDFGTPTRPNTQARPENIIIDVDRAVYLPRETFSPDGDGFEDVLEIGYILERPGALASVRIFDAQGRLVRNLTRTELLGSEGFLTWDGSNGEGRRAKAGLYVLLVELSDPNGEVRKEKLVAVLAGER